MGAACMQHHAYQDMSTFVYSEGSLVLNTQLALLRVGTSLPQLTGITTSCPPAALLCCFLTLLYPPATITKAALLPLSLWLPSALTHCSSSFHVSTVLFLPPTRHSDEHRPAAISHEPINLLPLHLAPRQDLAATCLPSSSDRPKWKEHRRLHTGFVNKVGSHDHPEPELQNELFLYHHLSSSFTQTFTFDFVHSLWHPISPQPNIDSIASVLIKGLRFLDRFCTPFILTSHHTLCLLSLAFHLDHLVSRDFRLLHSLSLTTTLHA